MIKGIGSLLRYEVKKLCSQNVNSIQRSKESGSIHNFPWDEILKEAKRNCPTLTKLLIAVSTTKTPRRNQMYLISTIICMLCKHRCSRMSLFQRLISVLLYSGHVGTKVCNVIPPLCIFIGILCLYIRFTNVFRRLC